MAKKKKSSTPKFSFDAKKATKQYKKLADAIYNPQISALQTQQTVNQNLAEQQKVTTKQQFADLLKSTIESINRQGAFFGGGSIVNQNKINTDQTTALNNIDLQTTMANQGISSQIGELQGRKAEYIQSGVNTMQSSAYNQFQDALQNSFRQQTLDLQAQQDALQQANADRNYSLSVSRANKAKTVNMQQATPQRDAFGNITATGSFDPRTGVTTYTPYTQPSTSTQQTQPKQYPWSTPSPWASGFNNDL